MTELAAHGVTVAAPGGWEGRIFRRTEHGAPEGLEAQEVPGAPAPDGAQTYAVVHVATIPVPVDAADYGSDVVEDLGPDDALIVLKEFAPSSVGTPLFQRAGMPRRLGADDFDPSTLQRSLPGLAGHQAFFHEGGRAFCLYVVLGEFARRAWIVPRVNEVLASMRIDRA
ncbi:MAG: hypothetical protein WEC34_14245 [Acidimicrobiia bacterium]